MVVLWMMKRMMDIALLFWPPIPSCVSNEFTNFLHSSCDTDLWPVISNINFFVSLTSIEPSRLISYLFHIVSINALSKLRSNVTSIVKTLLLPDTFESFSYSSFLCALFCCCGVRCCFLLTDLAALNLNALYCLSKPSKKSSALEPQNSSAYLLAIIIYFSCWIDSFSNPQNSIEEISKINKKIIV